MSTLQSQVHNRSSCQTKKDFSGKNKNPTVFRDISTGLPNVNHDSCPTSYIISVVLCLPVPCFHLAQLVTVVSEQGKMDGGI